MRIGIINLNSGNLLSIVSAFSKTGNEVVVLDKPDSNFDVLVMPGQGRFGFVADQLNKNNWREFILDWIAQDKLFIGICVGMQLLFESSQEDTGAKGLAIFTGEIEKLDFPKTPMVGWAQLNSVDENSNGNFVYFVNSFGVRNSEFCQATVNYGNDFCAIVQKDNVYGFQFHPEKSGDYGLQLINETLQGVAACQN